MGDNPLPDFAHEVSGMAGGPWLTFVPGIGNDRHFWSVQANALNDRFCILTFDPWGHGESPPPPENCCFQDIVSGLEQLWDRLSIQATSVVGLGFGGSLALAAALENPTRVQRVVACCCRPRQPDDRRDFWRSRSIKAAEIGIDRLADITVERWLNEDFRAAHPEIDKQLRDMFKRTTLTGYQAYVMAFAEMDFSARLADIAAPTLLVAGELDHGGGPVEDMRVMAAAIPNARLEVIQGAGHIINFEAPEAVTRILILALSGYAP